MDKTTMKIQVGLISAGEMCGDLLEEEIDEKAKERLEKAREYIKKAVGQIALLERGE